MAPRNINQRRKAFFGTLIFVFCSAIIYASISETISLHKSSKLYQKIAPKTFQTDPKLEGAKNCGSYLFPDATLKLANPSAKYKLHEARAVEDEVGQIRKFNAIDFTTGQATKEITARAELVGAYAYFYVDTTQTFNPEQLDALLFLFDNQIYITNTQVFGSEPKPGIDGDERITVLFLAIEEPASVVGDVAGYFWSGNQFSRSQVSRSNEREMLYMDITRLRRFGVEDVAGTLAHEFQHLIHWNHDRNEEVWINEGLSEYATFRNGFRLTNSPSLFLDNTDFTLMSWSSHPRDYARSFLWIAYLADHYGGDVLLRSIVANAGSGISALQTILSQRAPGLTVDDVFANWVIANYLDYTADGDSLFGYLSLDLPNLRPTETFAFLPVDQRTTAVNTYAADYYVFDGGEDLVVHLNGPDDELRFKARLIKLQSHSAPEVLDFPLDGDNDGALSIPDFGISAAKVVLAPFYLENPNVSPSIEYTFFAEGSGGPQAFHDTLQYHDSVSRTIISLGLPSPILNSEHLDSYAVRFTPTSDGILSGAELGVWNRKGSGGTVRFFFYNDDESRPGHPGVKIDSVDVLNVNGTPGSITWNPVDFSTRNVPVKAGEDFHLAWELVNPGLTDTVFAILDTAKVATDRSSVFVRERQRWAHFTSGLNFFMRAIVSVPADPTVPKLTAGLLQNPVFSQAVDIFVIAENPLHPASVDGQFILSGAPTPLKFRAINDSSKVFIADDFKLTAAGAAQIIVSARHRFGVAVGRDTLEVSVSLVDAQKGGIVTSPDNKLTLNVLPKSVSKAAYFTTVYERIKQSQVIAVEDDVFAPTGLGYRIGPAGFTFENMLELSFHYDDDHIAMQSENDLTIAAFEDNQWIQLGGELYRSSKTIKTLVNRTGVYALFVKKSAPAEETSPFTFYLNQNFPNPFNPKTTIKFGIPRRSHVTVRIINLKGQLITTLIDDELNPGDHVVEWDATDDKKLPVASGVYLYQLQAGDFVAAKKLLFVK